MNQHGLVDELAVVLGASRIYGTGISTNTALKHADVSIRAGDRIALVGQSGSGKSTLLHLIAGLDQPTTGTIDWPALGGRGSLRPLKIGMMTQSPSLIPWLTVEENVALARQLAGLGNGAEERAKAALSDFGIAGLANKLPEQISGGQAQRVSLARATVNDPPLLLADEPTGQVDHATGAALMDSLLAWADKVGAAVVIATHDLAIAQRMRTILQMDHGVLRPDERKTS